MIKENMDYAWKYFSLHADQRLKTFHFFVVLSALISGATIAIIKNATNSLYAFPMAYLLTFLAIVFWKLDQRNKALIKHAEKALKELEKIKIKDADQMIKLFSDEEATTVTRKNHLKLVKEEAFSYKKLRSYFETPLSYSDCFNSVFFVFGSIGLIIGSTLLIRGCL